MLRLFAALASILLVAPLPGEAQNARAGMTMHRIQAGEMDATGWTTAVSTEGRFSVRLPLRYNDFTLAESDRNSRVDKTFVVGTKSAEGIKLVASRMTYRKPGAARDFFAAAEGRRGFAAKASQHRKFDFRGSRAVEMMLSERGTLLFQRLLLLEADLMSLTLEAPRAHEALARRLVGDFFDSLVVAEK